MRRKAKRDTIEREVVSLFQAYGFHVCQISAPGIPDLMIADEHVIALVEVKSGKYGTLTTEQVEFHSTFPNPHCYVVRSLEDVAAVADELRGVT